MYSPHTAVDAVPGGMADWLCDIVSGKIQGPEESTPRKIIQRGISSYSQVIYPLPQENMTSMLSVSVDAHTREPIRPSPEPVPSGFEGAGAGRLLTFKSAQPLNKIVNRICAATGYPGSISVAIPQGQTITSMDISTVGVCPGSGGSVFQGTKVLPDLLFTGELSHHEALAAIERGSAVVTVFHSNSERGYLRDVMKRKLMEGIKQEIADAEIKLEDDNFVSVSEADRDPFGVLIRI